MSSAHGAEAKSDTPWMIGSALVFGPLFIWLVSPTAKSKAHDVHEKALPKSKSSGHGEAPVPAPSVESATEAPSGESTETVTDDEGTAASNAEVAESINKAVDEDSPKEAAAPSEAIPVKGETKSHDEADSGEYKAKAATSETGPEQDKTVGDKKTDETPSDVGEARAKSTGGKSPKESDKEDQSKGQ